MKKLIICAFAAATVAATGQQEVDSRINAGFGTTYLSSVELQNTAVEEIEQFQSATSSDQRLAFEGFGSYSQSYKAIQWSIGLSYTQFNYKIGLEQPYYENGEVQTVVTPTALRSNATVVQSGFGINVNHFFNQTKSTNQKWSLALKSVVESGLGSSWMSFDQLNYETGTTTPITRSKNYVLMGFKGEIEAGYTVYEDIRIHFAAGYRYLTGRKMSVFNFTGYGSNDGYKYRHSLSGAMIRVGVSVPIH
ncbi:MAG: hypothetical protein KDC12_14595 [Flavobacteriales bacterium]|nr:hypothetical protein [Flavobacteriales bacterium]